MKLPAAVVGVIITLLFAVALLVFCSLVDYLARWRKEKRLADEWSRLYARGMTSKRFEEWKEER